MKHTINERNAGTIRAPFTHAIKVSIEKFVPAYFKTFLDNFGCVLIHAVLGGIVNNGINGSRAVERRPVLARLGLEIWGGLGERGPTKCVECTSSQTDHERSDQWTRGPR